MPVTMLNQNVESLGLLEQLGVAGHLIEQAKLAGVMVSSTSNALVFTLKSGQSANVKMNMGAVALVKKGMLGTVSKENMCAQVTSSLTSLLNMVKPSPEPKLTEADLSDVAEAISVPKPGAVFPNEFPTEKPKPQLGPAILKSAKVPLSAATELYQPVAATDATSVYHVVALASGLHVAARIRSHRVSVRVEGPEMSSHKAALEGMGLTPSGSSHWSIHCETEDKKVGCQVVGAILSGLGIPFYTQFPNLHLIAGKGK